MHQFNFNILSINLANSRFLVPSQKVVAQGHLNDTNDTKGFGRGS